VIVKNTKKKLRWCWLW